MSTALQAPVRTLRPTSAKIKRSDPIDYSKDRVVQLYQRCIPAVPMIVSTECETDPNACRPTGLGSGVGLLLANGQKVVTTNVHVIEHSDKIRVHWQGMEGEFHPAEVLAMDPEADVAVLRITDKFDFPTLDVAAEGTPPGAWCMSLGYPFGAQKIACVGVVSARRSDQPGPGGVALKDLVITDAGIHPGNSGGPLVNEKGEVFAKNTWKWNGAAIGAAVPEEYTLNLLDNVDFDTMLGRLEVSPGLFVINGPDGPFVWKVTKGSRAQGEKILPLCKEYVIDWDENLWKFGGLIPWKTEAPKNVPREREQNAFRFVFRLRAVCETPVKNVGDIAQVLKGVTERLPLFTFEHVTEKGELKIRKIRLPVVR